MIVATFSESSGAWLLRHPVFLGNVRGTCSGGRLRWSFRWSKPDSCADVVVQDMLRYMFANRR